MSFGICQGRYIDGVSLRVSTGLLLPMGLSIRADYAIL